MAAAAKKATTPPAVSRRVLVGTAVAFAIVTLMAQVDVSWLETRTFEVLTGHDGWWEQLLTWIQPAGTLFTVVGAALLVAIFNRDYALRMGLSGSVAWLATQVAKVVVGRARPDVLLDIQPSVVLESAGYPSGHTATIVALVVALWPELYRGERLAAAAIAMLVALGRMELGVHLPLDVLGGALLGALVAMSVQALLAGSRS